jgi:hypothetical protein
MYSDLIFIPTHEFWWACLSIFTYIWFAALLFIVFQIVFGLVVKIAYKMFFLSEENQ